MGYPRLTLSGLTQMGKQLHITVRAEWAVFSLYVVYYLYMKISKNWGFSILAVIKSSSVMAPNVVGTKVS